MATQFLQEIVAWLIRNEIGLFQRCMFLQTGVRSPSRCMINGWLGSIIGFSPRLGKVSVYHQPASITPSVSIYEVKGPTPPIKETLEISLSNVRRSGIFGLYYGPESLARELTRHKEAWELFLSQHGDCPSKGKGYGVWEWYPNPLRRLRIVC